MNSTRTRTAATAAVVTVAGIAAVVSYSHIYALAIDHGQSVLAARLLPFAIDGGIIAASLAMLGGQAPKLSRLMFALGVLATLGANVAGGWHCGPVGIAVSGFPAVSFLGSVELLARMRSKPAATEVAESPSVPALGRDAETVAVAATVAESPSVARVAVARVAPVASDAMAAALDILASDPTLTGADLGRRLNVSPRSGQRIMRRLAAQGA